MIIGSFERAVEFVLRFEADYVNDPKDAGGETKFGISKRSYPNLDIKNLTREDAIEIYRRDFWIFCKCAQLPAPLAFILFDGAVNQGGPAAIRLLQKALNVRADGIIGPETFTALQTASLRGVACDFVARRAYQYSLHPQVARFGLGWYRRLSECHQLATEPQ